MTAGLIVSSARAVILRGSAVGLCAFLRVMPADQTPHGRAYDPMMACIVAGNAPDDGPFETAFGRDGSRDQRS